MPLSAKGKRIMKKMRKTYGSEKKAKEVFYASVNKGKIKGVEKKEHNPKSKKRRNLRSVKYGW